MELKSVFEQIQAAEAAGNLSPEEKKRLEEQAAEKGLQALFKVSLLLSSAHRPEDGLIRAPWIQGTKLEVESVLRETCDRVLEDPTVSRNKAQLRAVALQILGDAYMAVRKDGSNDSNKDDSEYVRVETTTSRQRDAQRQQQS